MIPPLSEKDQAMFDKIVADLPPEEREFFFEALEGMPRAENVNKILTWCLMEIGNPENKSKITTMELIRLNQEMLQATVCLWIFLQRESCKPGSYAEVKDAFLELISGLMDDEKESPSIDLGRIEKV
jgi:hypothetical protein